MKCPICSNDITDDAQFCGRCGTSLSAPTASGSGVGTAEPPMVSFTSAVIFGFQRYFQFSGRSTRAEYWWWVLFLELASLILAGVDSLIGSDKFAEPGQSGLLGFLFGLATLIPSLALGARRLHDIGKSGWWQLGIILLPTVWGVTAAVVAVISVFGDDGNLGLALTLILVGIVGLCVSLGGIVWWILWFARKGDTVPNKYGPDPRQATSQ